MGADASAYQLRAGGMGRGRLKEALWPLQLDSLNPSPCTAVVGMDSFVHHSWSHLPLDSYPPLISFSFPYLLFFLSLYPPPPPHSIPKDYKYTIYWRSSCVEFMSSVFFFEILYVYFMPSWKKNCFKNKTMWILLHLLKLFIITLSLYRILIMYKIDVYAGIKIILFDKTCEHARWKL